MMDWTFFLTVVGAAFLTAQLFRLIDLIERPARRPEACRRPASFRRVRLRTWSALFRAVRRELSWTSWKS